MNQKNANNPVKTQAKIKNKINKSRNRNGQIYREQ